MKNFIIILAVLAQLVSSCTKKTLDEDLQTPVVENPPADNNGTILSKEIRKIYTNGIITNTYTYNYIYENNLLSKITFLSASDNSVGNFSYVYLNGKTIEENYESIPNTFSFKSNFTYNGLLIASSTGMSSYVGSNNNVVNSTYSTTYTYNINNRLINATEYRNGVPNSETTYEYYTNGNKSKMIRTTITNSTTTNYESYDNKVNPYFTSLTPATLALNTISTNNCTQRGTTTYEYAYNTSNLPVKVTQKEAGAIKEVSTYQYY